ncbi:MAG: rhomboid family intramembrane serine protease [Planctomycetota bacterium]
MSWRDRKWADPDGGQFFPRQRPVATLWMLGILAGFSLLLWLVGGGVRGETTGIVRDGLSLDADRLYLPWTWLSYALVHWDPGHLIGNIFYIAIAGWILESYFGARHFLLVTAGLAVFAGLGFIVESLLTVTPRFCLGASGAALGLVVLLGSRFPRLELLIWGIIPMKCWVLATLLVFIDIMRLVAYQGGDGTAHSVHLAGAFGGFAYGFLWPRLGGWRDEVAEQRERKRHERAQEKDETERLELDRLLDKIAREGMDRLTERERRFLLSQSKKLKDGNRR